MKNVIKKMLLFCCLIGFASNLVAMRRVTMPRIASVKNQLPAPAKKVVRPQAPSTARGEIKTPRLARITHVVSRPASDNFVDVCKSRNLEKITEFITKGVLRSEDIKLAYHAIPDAKYTVVRNFLAIIHTIVYENRTALSVCAYLQQVRDTKDDEFLLQLASMIPYIFEILAMYGNQNFLAFFLADKYYSSKLNDACVKNVLAKILKTELGYIADYIIKHRLNRAATTGNYAFIQWVLDNHANRISEMQLEKIIFDLEDKTGTPAFASMHAALVNQHNYRKMCEHADNTDSEIDEDTAVEELSDETAITDSTAYYVPTDAGKNKTSSSKHSEDDPESIAILQQIEAEFQEVL